tara:strand:- start:2751 stop:2924 length:174 start_codon:yes stop_codon:yes gene_type:complete
MAPGSGLFTLGAGIINDVGKLDASINARVSESVSLFASGSVDTAKNWQAMTGLRVEW